MPQRITQKREQDGPRNHPDQGSPQVVTKNYARGARDQVERVVRDHRNHTKVQDDVKAVPGYSPKDRVKAFAHHAFDKSLSEKAPGPERHYRAHIGTD